MQVLKRSRILPSCTLGVFLFLFACAGSSGYTPTPQATHPASGSFTSYAFVRVGQLYVSLKGAAPAQVTHFNPPLDDVNLFWDQVKWSPDDHYIVFTLRGTGGLGGAGWCNFGIDNGGPFTAWPGAFYVLDTTTMQLTRHVLPVQQGDAQDNDYNGHWTYLFWEDATHLLAWNSGTNSKSSIQYAGLYRYDLQGGTFTQVLTASSLQGLSLGNTIWYPFRYVHGDLYYQTIKKVNNDYAEFDIYRHSVSHPSQHSVQVYAQGIDLYCYGGSPPTPPSNPHSVSHPSQHSVQVYAQDIDLYYYGGGPPTPPRSGPFSNPGWDISPDGNHLVTQHLSGNTSSIVAVDLHTGKSRQLFTGLPAKTLQHDLVLTWAPDNQTVLLTNDGPYTASLAQPNSQAYSAYKTIHAIWTSDSSHFLLYQNATQPVSAPQITVNTYTLGSPDSSVFLSDARSFAIG